MKESKIEINEELITDLGQALRWFYDAGRADERDYHKEGEFAKSLFRTNAEAIIVRILSAVCDGQKLPGEQWRADFEGYIDTDADVIDGNLDAWQGDELKLACRLIALRPDKDREASSE